MIMLFSRTDGAVWNYPLADSMAGINAVVAALDEPAPEP
jgi:hypothetical protein